MLTAKTGPDIGSYTELFIPEPKDRNACSGCDDGIKWWWVCWLQVTTASKNQGRHAQSVEDIIRVSMQTTLVKALHSAFCI